MIKVKDTGIGIDKEDISHIFNRFYQAKKTDISFSYNMEVRMVYNHDFLSWYEEFFIKNGILFTWVIYKNEYIGLKAFTDIDLTPILKDCMTLEHFSWNREYMKSLEKIK